MDRQLQELRRAWRSSGSHEDLRAYVRGLRRSGITSLEVTDLHPEPIYGAFWPSVTYRDLNIIDIIVALDSHWNPTSYELYSFGDGITDAEENFLGYIPSQNFFIMGWNAWRVGEIWGDEEEQEESFGGFFAVLKVVPTDDPNFWGHSMTMLHVDGHPIASWLLSYFETSMPVYYGGKLNPEIRHRFPDLIGLRYD